ncbi:hypothetical protein ACWZHB_26140 [Nocardia sp. FBN12]|uniref:hypothetical protein n=1 Tax=Nocardia sp. FBN12 TaxID=3419766 RepID=UPI003D03BEC3
MHTNPTGTPMGVELSPDRRKRAAQRRQREEQRWTAKSGPVVVSSSDAEVNSGVQVGNWVRTKTGTRAHYVREIAADGTYRTLCGKVRGVKDRAYDLKSVVAIDDPTDMECQYCFGRCGKEGIRLLRS